MTLYLCVVKWLVLYWEHEEGVSIISSVLILVNNS